MKMQVSVAKKQKVVMLEITFEPNVNGRNSWQ